VLGRVAGDVEFVGDGGVGAPGGGQEDDPGAHGVLLAAGAGADADAARKFGAIRGGEDHRGGTAGHARPPSTIDHRPSMATAAAHRALHSVNSQPDRPLG
jgi:hypothetical protein